MILGKNMMTLSGEKINPYSLEAMNRAAHILHQSKGYPLMEIQANALYVRFSPSGDVEYNYLIEQSELELFSYPLDQVIHRVGEYYREPQLPSYALFPYLYTTIYPSQQEYLSELFKLFPKLKMEVLEHCYLPLSPHSSPQFEYEQELELQAIKLASPYISVDSPAKDLPSGGYFPCGRLEFKDNQTHKYSPIKGIKVRANYFVKWSATYSDEAGNYQLDLPFFAAPCYSIYFQSQFKYSIFQGIDLLSPVRMMIGRGDDEGLNLQISPDHPLWGAASINDAAYDYFTTCREEGMTPPPSFLKIWHWHRFRELSSAPMLKHLKGAVSYFGAWNIRHFFEYFFKGAGINFALFSLKRLLPDILIGRCHHQSTVFYNSVTHELAHASHFAQVGDAYWHQYISFILSHKELYGSDNEKNSGVCAVGEMWGYAIGNIMQARKYGFGYSFGDGYWFQPKIIENLIKHTTFQMPEILKALTPEVTSVEKFYKELFFLYPSRYQEITKVFKSYT